MPFIGNQPAESYSAFQKQDFTTSATTSYTLDNPVANANELALFINFVRQEPTAAYSASGTTLTLTSATASSDDMYCVYLGKAVQTVNPPNNSVTNAMIVDGTIAESKLASGVNTITMVDGWRITANTNQATNGDVSSNWERIDTDSYGVIGTGLTESSGVFTFPSTGIYSINLGARIEVNATDSAANIDIQTTTDNSSYNRATMVTCGSPTSGTHAQTAFGQFIFDATNTTTHKFKFVTHSMGTNSYLKGSTDENQTYFYVTRLGDT